MKFGMIETWRKEKDEPWTIRVYDLCSKNTRYLPYPTEQEDPIRDYFVCEGMVLFQAVNSFKVFRFDPVLDSIQQAGQLGGVATGFGHWRGDYYAFMPGGEVLKLHNSHWIPWDENKSAPQIHAVLANSNELEEEHGIIGVYQDPEVGKALGFYRPDNKAWSVIACAPSVGEDEDRERFLPVGVIGSRVVVEVSDEGDYKGYDVCSREWSGFELFDTGLQFPVALVADGYVYYNHLPARDEGVELYRAQVDWNQECLVSSVMLFHFRFKDLATLF